MSRPNPNPIFFISSAVVIAPARNGLGLFYARSNPMEKAVEMALKLGVCVEWLLTGRGPMQPPKPATDLLDLSELPDDAKRNLRALVESIKPTVDKRLAA